MGLRASTIQNHVYAMNVAKHYSDKKETGDLSSAQFKDVRNKLIRTVMQKTGWRKLECFMWFYIGIPKLGGRSPKELIEQGKLKKLQQYVDEEIIT